VPTSGEDVTFNVCVRDKYRKTMLKELSKSLFGHSPSLMTFGEDHNVDAIVN